MKYSALISLSIIILISCQKNNHSTLSGNKLKSISSDSAGKSEFTYNGDTITNISGNLAATVQYLKYGDTPCVSLSFGADGTKYYLNSFKLPIKINFYHVTNGVEVNSDYANFF